MNKRILFSFLFFLAIPFPLLSGAGNRFQYTLYEIEGIQNDSLQDSSSQVLLTNPLVVLVAVATVMGAFSWVESYFGFDESGVGPQGMTGDIDLPDYQSEFGPR